MSTSKSSPTIIIKDPLLMRYSSGETEYSIEDIFDGGFLEQQQVIEDKSNAKIIKGLIENKEPSIHIFIFKKSYDHKKIYKDLNEDPGIQEFKKRLFEGLKEKTLIDVGFVKTKKDIKNINMDDISIAIFPMRIWQSGTLLTENGYISNLFNCMKEKEIKHKLSFVTIKKTSKGGRRKRKSRKSTLKKRAKNNTLSTLSTFRKSGAKYNPLLENVIHF